jgi:DNA-directed RNA polymerase specialized sigma24 family protein
MAMLSYSNKKLLKGILEQDQSALNYLYRKLFPRVKRMINRYGGDHDIANEIFQESIIILYRKVMAHNMNGTIMVESYIIGVCKLVWLRLYDTEIKIFTKLDAVKDETDDSYEEAVLDFLASRRKKLFYEHFERLDYTCRRLLKDFFKGMDYEKIAEKYKLGTEENARKRKYLCKETLVKSIKDDPNFSKLIGEYDEDLFEDD